MTLWTDTIYPFTPGAISTDVSNNLGTSIYYMLPPSGSSVLYGSVVTPQAFSFQYHGMFVNDSCEVYLALDAKSNFPVTPSYRDYDTNTQKTVFDATYNGGGRDAGIMVLHEPKVTNNTIPNFMAGNNTFCVNGAIWQNPNDGPILGTDIAYVSGDGSSASHNLPNISIGGAISAHPTPASPAVQYQWQKRVNVGPWTNVANGTYPVYKPEPESTAGTVEYRRLVVGICCDTLSVSNTATATITGTFGMGVTVPTKPVYYCPGVAGTNLGVSVTGASGNISWQWYDGYAPLTGTGIISPSSGSGVPQGSFTAEVGTSVTGSGFYRLVVVDAGGCRVEKFVSIAPKTADAGTAGSMAMCPGGTTSVTLGPAAVNPDFNYSWTGPGGFTSSSPNPTVTVAGTYTLQVKLTTDGAFCAPGTTVTVTASTPHSAALTALPDKMACQDADPFAIGLAGTPPSGYVFQWSPGLYIDNTTTMNPVFDPGLVPGGGPIGSVTYTFTALRLSDGCIYEDQMMVTDTAIGFAFAGNDLIGDGCTTGTRNGVGANEAMGAYYQWRAVGTDFAAGLTALKAHASFGNDALGQQIGTNKFLNAKFPLCSVNGNVGYWIDYEQRVAYVPFPNDCYTVDTVRVYVPCCGEGPACPLIETTQSGTNGACSGAIMSISPVSGATYYWRTYKINGVLQAPGTAPRGLFVNSAGTKGAALSAVGPHTATSVFVDFDDVTWGWPGSNDVEYEIMQIVSVNGAPDTCFSRQKFFSSQLSTPVIGVLDQALCNIVSPGIRLGTSGQAAPYTLNGTDYTQAPNGSLLWTWTNADGSPAMTITSGANTPFPVVNPSSTTAYKVVVHDPLTGCTAKDTLTVSGMSLPMQAPI